MEQIFRQWIGMHRAMIAWYHAAHHVTKGAGFGGDHVNIYGEILFEKAFEPRGPKRCITITQIARA